MTVPEIDTSNIATFSWWRQEGCTEIRLADVVGYLHSYDQYPEYVDGTIKIFDSGGDSALPNNYNLVNVRIRSDGYILAWFAKTLTTGQTADSGSGTTLTDSGCEIENYHDAVPRAMFANELAGNMLEFTSGALNGNKYTIKSNTISTILLHVKYAEDISTSVSTVTPGDTYNISSNRGNLIWWGHDCKGVGNPTNQSTRLGRAIYQIWDQVKANQIGGDGAVVDYNDVNYYDYEYTNATHLYIVGQSKSKYSGIANHYFYFTVPSGITVYLCCLTKGSGHEVYNAYNYLNGVLINSTSKTNGWVHYDFTPVNSIRYKIRLYLRSTYQYTVRNNVALVLLTNG